MVDAGVTFVLFALLGAGIFSFFVFAAKKIMEKMVNHYLDDFDRKVEIAERKEELIIKGLIHINDRQCTIMDALKRASLNGTQIIPINGELELARKESIEYAKEWEKFLICNREK